MPVGKTTFLHLYLAWELAQGKVAMYWARDTLYLFAGQSTIYYTDRVSKVDLYEYSSALCFIDSDSTSSPPGKLTGNGQLFILQAAPPIPRLTTWTKRRPKVVTFVLNPPSKPEAVQASVFYSPFLHPFVTLTVPDCLQSSDTQIHQCEQSSD